MVCSRAISPCYRPAAQAAGFRILKPIAFATFAALEKAFVLLATLERVFIFLDAQLVKRYVVLLLIFNILPYGAFIESYCRYVVPFHPEVPVPELIFQVCMLVEHHSCTFSF